MCRKNHSPSVPRGVSYSYLWICKTLKERRSQILAHYECHKVYDTHGAWIWDEVFTSLVEVYLWMVHNLAIVIIQRFATSLENLTTAKLYYGPHFTVTWLNSSWDDYTRRGRIHIWWYRNKYYMILWTGRRRCIVIESFIVSKMCLYGCRWGCCFRVRLWWWKWPVIWTC